MSRPIRNVRAARLQGTRAGPFTRLLAMALDVGLAWVVFVLVFATTGLIWDFLHTGDVRLANPGPWITALIAAVVFVLLLTFGWSTTGRSFGKQVLGLRVVADDATTLTVRAAFLRALTYLVFPLGGAWIVFSRRNASLQDRLVRTVVVHDWMPAPSPLQDARSRRRSGEQST